MRCTPLLLAALVAILASCSSSGQTVDPDASSPDAASGTHECPANVKGWPFDAARSCFSKNGVMSGICVDRPPPPNSTGLEAVCAVDGAGNVFVVIASTDTTLSGAGWTFGSRAAPNLVHDNAPLSSANEGKCAAAAAQISGVQPRAGTECRLGDGGL
ncbi:hypothetical protein BH09MYX1_BH09MYX1_28420 [soil metagenome]